jgi:glycosyltransferase involved in cell wall biosynthesis
VEASGLVSRVALVLTVFNEAATLNALLTSVDEQTLQPDEMVVVDGGSTDATVHILERRTNPRCVVLKEPGANIARGRNAAIAASTADVIAVTDGGCVLEPRWLERLAKGCERADVAMGYYRPLAATFFERATACLTLPAAAEVDARRFMPSSRSIAFRRSVWERVGGYPEWLDVGEDMYFDFAVLAAGASRTFVRDAVVGWRMRPTLLAFLRQYFRYARGDAVAGMYPRRHALRFGSYAATAALFAAARRWPWLAAIPLAGISYWLRPAYGRAMRLSGWQRAAAFAAMPALLVLQDAAKMAGYVSGLPGRRRK